MDHIQKTNMTKRRMRLVAFTTTGILVAGMTVALTAGCGIQPEAPATRFAETGSAVPASAETGSAASASAETDRPVSTSAETGSLESAPEEEKPATMDPMAEISRIVFEEGRKAATSCQREVVALIVAGLGRKGYVAVDSGNQVDMAGAEQVLEFCETAEQGEKGELTVVVVDSPNDFLTYDLETQDGGLTVTRMDHKLKGNLDFQVESTTSYPADFWEYTEEGYLVFEGNAFSEAEYVLTLSNTPEHTALRVLPLDKACREYNRNYVLPIGYGWNNLFLCNWSEDDYGTLDFYDLFDILYPRLYEQPVPYIPGQGPDEEGICLIPEELFESVIREYFSIDPETLRSKTTYLPDKAAYEYRPRGADEAQYPEIPWPEVIAYTENQDGTVTLTVNGVYPYENTSRSFSHQTVIRLPDPDHVQYVSNTILPQENAPDFWWHHDRLAKGEWEEHYR